MSAPRRTPATARRSSGMRRGGCGRARARESAAAPSAISPAPRAATPPAGCASERSTRSRRPPIHAHSASARRDSASPPSSGEAGNDRRGQERRDQPRPRRQEPIDRTRLAGGRPAPRSHTRRVADRADRSAIVSLGHCRSSRRTAAGLAVVTKPRNAHREVAPAEHLIGDVHEPRREILRSSCSGRVRIAVHAGSSIPEIGADIPAAQDTRAAHRSASSSPCRRAARPAAPRAETLLLGDGAVPAFQTSSATIATRVQSRPDAAADQPPQRRQHQPDRRCASARRVERRAVERPDEPRRPQQRHGREHDPRPARRSLHRHGSTRSSKIPLALASMSRTRNRPKACRSRA